mgnify:CR=1 FL=1
MGTRHCLCGRSRGTVRTRTLLASCHDSHASPSHSCNPHPSPPPCPPLLPPHPTSPHLSQINGAGLIKRSLFNWGFSRKLYFLRQGYAHNKVGRETGRGGGGGRDWGWGRGKGEAALGSRGGGGGGRRGEGGGCIGE